MAIEWKTTRTWKERIMATVTGRNDRGAFLWYSHDKIRGLIAEAEGFDIKRHYKSGISPYLTALVKSGHLERAVKPRQLSNKVQDDGRPEYLYRATGKAYARGMPHLSSSKNAHTNAYDRSSQGHELWRLYPSLPKWFRRMMMD